MLRSADEECSELWESLSLAYTYQEGLPELRQEIAGTYNGGITDQQCTVVVPAEGILLASLALLESGDHIVAVQPCYQSLTEVLTCRPASIHAFTQCFSHQDQWNLTGAALMEIPQML